MTSPASTRRLSSIDALRGLVMVVMLLDHVRDTFYTHMTVSDPVDARLIAPAFFATRLLSSICAPVFIALTGLSAWLYGRTRGRAATSAFLLKRGLFLMVLEVTLVGFAWDPRLPPQTLWLQVIWAIGASMVALAALIHLPRGWIIAIGATIVLGHNLLDPVAVPPDHPLHIPWALLHHREAFQLGALTVKTSYPILPWIGVIALGHAVGPWFGGDAALRRRRLILWGVGLLLGFVLLRAINLYGDAPWFVVPGSPLRTAMSMVALTKYPPSLLYLLPTLGIGLVLLAAFERRDGPIARRLAVLGGAPMGFYLLHLYALRLLYLAALAFWGPNQGKVYGFESLGSVWLLAAVLIVLLYPPTRWFAGLKRRRPDLTWLKYF